MKDTTKLLSIVVVAVCAIRFLIDGVTFMFYGHVVSLPHTEASAYAAFLTPVLGGHAFINRTSFTTKKPINVDNPDA